MELDEFCSYVLIEWLLILVVLEVCSVLCISIKLDLRLLLKLSEILFIMLLIVGIRLVMFLNELVEKL